MIINWYDDKHIVVIENVCHIYICYDKNEHADTILNVTIYFVNNRQLNFRACKQGLSSDNYNYLNQIIEKLEKAIEQE